MMNETVCKESREMTRLERVLMRRSYDEIINMMISGEVRQYDVREEHEINKLVGARIKCAPERVAAYRAYVEQLKYQEFENKLKELPRLMTVFSGGAM